MRVTDVNHKYDKTNRENAAHTYASRVETVNALV